MGHRMLSWINIKIWFYCFPFTMQQDPDKFTESIMLKLFSRFFWVCQKIVLYTENKMWSLSQQKNIETSMRNCVDWAVILLMASGISNARFQAIGLDQTSSFLSICIRLSKNVPQKSWKNMWVVITPLLKLLYSCQNTELKYKQDSFIFSTQYFVSLFVYSFNLSFFFCFNRYSRRKWIL